MQGCHGELQQEGNNLILVKLYIQKSENNLHKYLCLLSLIIHDPQIIRVMRVMRSNNSESSH